MIKMNIHSLKHAAIQKLVKSKIKLSKINKIVKFILKIRILFPQQLLMKKQLLF
jgi:hypothetical protein